MTSIKTHLLGMAAAMTLAIGGSAAQADVFSIDDSGSNLVVNANGFLINYLVVNGTTMTAGDSDYSNRSLSFAKGTTLTFSGTFDTYNATGAGSLDWLLVYASAPTTVVGELVLNYDGTSGDEAITGTYWGVDSGHTFSTTGTYETLLPYADITYYNTNVAVNGLFQVVEAGDTAAVPEPASWAMMVGGFGLIGGALRRRKAQLRFA